MSTTIKGITFHLPVRQLCSAVCLLALAYVSWWLLPTYVVPGMIEILQLRSQSAWQMLWVPSAVYLLMAVSICLLMNLGPQPLKGWKERGLLKLLGLGFLLGLPTGFVVGLVLVPVLGISVVPLGVTAVLLLSLATGAVTGYFDEIPEPDQFDAVHEFDE